MLPLKVAQRQSSGEDWVDLVVKVAQRQSSGEDWLVVVKQRNLSCKSPIEGVLKAEKRLI